MFEKGTFIDANSVKVVITQSDLKELADCYDGINHPSPSVTGHPKDNDPALGLASSFSVAGNKLIGFSNKIHENLINAVNEEPYKKISLSIYDPESTSNPVIGNDSFLCIEIYYKNLVFWFRLPQKGSILIYKNMSLQVVNDYF